MPSAQGHITVRRRPRDGQSSFKSIVFKRASSTPSTPTGGSYASSIPTGWSDGIPSGTDKLWMSTRIFTSDGETPQQSVWTDPAQTTSTTGLWIYFSSVVTPGNPTDNEANWHATGLEADIWMAMKVVVDGYPAASWSIMKIKGEAGTNGTNGVDAITVEIENQNIIVTADSENVIEDTINSIIKVLKGTTYLNFGTGNVGTNTWYCSKEYTGIGTPGFYGGPSSDFLQFVWNGISFDSDTRVTATVVLTITVNGVNFTKVLTISRSDRSKIIKKGDYSATTQYSGTVHSRDAVKYRTSPTAQKYWYLAKMDAGAITVGTVPTDTAKWQIMNNFSSVATDLFLTENANIANFIFLNDRMESQNITPVLISNFSKSKAMALGYTGQALSLYLGELSSAPTPTVTGQVYYNTTLSLTYKWNGASWGVIGTETVWLGEYATAPTGSSHANYVFRCSESTSPYELGKVYIYGTSWTEWSVNIPNIILDALNNIASFGAGKALFNNYSASIGNFDVDTNGNLIGYDLDNRERVRIQTTGMPVLFEETCILNVTAYVANYQGASGYVTISLAGDNFEVTGLTTGDGEDESENEWTAMQIRAFTFAGWAVSGSGTQVIFKKNQTNIDSPAPELSAGDTGMTGTWTQTFTLAYAQALSGFSQYGSGIYYETDANGDFDFDTVPLTLAYDYFFNLASGSIIQVNNIIEGVQVGRPDEANINTTKTIYVDSVEVATLESNITLSGTSHCLRVEMSAISGTGAPSMNFWLTPFINCLGILLKQSTTSRIILGGDGIYLVADATHYFYYSPYYGLETRNGTLDTGIRSFGGANGVGQVWVNGAWHDISYT